MVIPKKVLLKRACRECKIASAVLSVALAHSNRDKHIPPYSATTVVAPPPSARVRELPTQPLFPLFCPFFPVPTVRECPCDIPLGLVYRTPSTRIARRSLVETLLPIRPKSHLSRESSEANYAPS